MKKLNTIPVLLFLFTYLYSSAQTQPNNFKIGIYNGWGHSYTSSGELESRKYYNNNTNGIYSSTMGVLKEDGFNLVEYFWPSFISSENTTFGFYRKLADLANNNDSMKITDHLEYWYKPKINSTAPWNYDEGGSINQYTVNQDGTSLGNNSLSAKILYNYEYLFDAVYNVYPYNRAFFAHRIGGEMSCFHNHQVKDKVLSQAYYGFSFEGTFNGKTLHVEYPNYAVELPLTNVSDAIGYFKGKRNGQKQYITIAPAKHSDYLKQTPYYYDAHDYPFYGKVFEEDYLTTTNKADLYTEASYFSNNFWSWPSSDAYLGKFISIDYARGKGYSNIIAEFSVEQANPELTLNPYFLHSHPDIPNGNQLRFQVYTSIIHGVNGVTFYSLDDSFDPNLNADIASKAIFNGNALKGGGTNTNPYKRAYFPNAYQKYICKLSRELQYLVKKDFISTDVSKVLYKKTVGTDPYGILPSSTTYLLQQIPGADMRDYNKVNSIPENTPYNNNLKRDEAHGLRYEIVSNGLEAVMIVSNPNPYSIHNIPFNFAGITNPLISNAKFVDVLFDNGFITNVNDPNYKTDTSTSVTPGSFDLVKKHTFAFCNKTFTTDFGPFDVKIFNFKASVTNGPDYKNGWAKEWSNFANGTIGTWTVTATDKFIPFDADGNDDEELLCVQALNSGAKATLFNYTTANGWQSIFTNNGNGSFNKNTFSGWGIRAADKYVVGDFDGDGKNNELLCVQGDGGFATILKYNPSTNNFDWYWDNAGNGSFNSQSFTGWGINAGDKYQVGDFNNDGKNNDLFCISTGGCWGLLNFNITSPKNFILFAVDCNNKIAAGPTVVWNMSSSDEYRVGDFDNDTKRNDILCTERATGNQIRAIKYNNGWTSLWGTGNGNIGGWGAPLRTDDMVLTGNLDTDSKDELMFIQRCYNCGYAATEDLSGSPLAPQWNWSNHDVNFTGSMVNYINDWRVSDINAAYNNYLLIKPVTGDNKKYLLAFKKYPCNGYLVSMYRAFTVGGHNYKMGTNNNGTVSVEEPISNTNDFNLFPNPTSGSFTLQFNNSSLKKISVYNIMGARVYENETDKGELLIDLKDRDAGIYFVKVQDGTGLYTRKVVIQ